MQTLKTFAGLLLLIMVSSNGYGQADCVDYQAAVPLYKGEWNPLWNFPNSTHPVLRQKKITGLNFGTYFRGLLEYKPADYNPSNSVKHPLIIYFHGGASKGLGTELDLCRLFKDNQNNDFVTYKSLPGRIERNNTEFTKGGRSYLVVSPQFFRYDRVYPEPQGGNFYPSAEHVERVIDYVLQRYAGKVDEQKIYLTGYSNGANMIMEYVGSSEARARRIAAVMPVALCSQLYHYSNTNIGVSVANIAKAKLKVWFVQCEADVPCGLTPTEWYDGIRNAPGSAMPRYTILKNQNPATLYNCSDTLLHDAWSRAYDPNFKASFTNGSGANDGINLNVYDWFMQQSNTVLPVTLKSFTAIFKKRQVVLDWITIHEENNASFTLERAGPDMRFFPIVSLPGAGNFSGDRRYSFTDIAPLSGLNFYRLVQTDIDGEKTYFDTKRVVNQEAEGPLVAVTPNPFHAEVSAYISLNRAQQVTLTVTDMTGKTIRRIKGNYAQGVSKVKLGGTGLPGGLYFLKVEGEDFRLSKKIIKQ